MPNPFCATEVEARDDGGAQTLVAETLTLLTLYARSPTLDAADTIARQLAALARHPALTPALQGTCTQLFLDWLGPVDMQDCGPERQWRTVHEMPSLPQ